MKFLLTVVYYPWYFAPLGFISMAIFRLYFIFSSKVKFWKLMGCGKNGSFDITPDLQRWAVASVWQTDANLADFRENSWISTFWSLFASEKWHLTCEPIESHGKWEGVEPFGQPDKIQHEGPIAVLTRATIRIHKAMDFWRNVPKVSENFKQTEGLISSIGIGEVPFLKQATFSIWQNEIAMKKFAYQQSDHKNVILKTRKNNWYKEELFARFKITNSEGFYRGQDMNKI